MTAIVQTKELGKQYGKRWALENLNLTIDQGEIVGFIGPNGAGKPTLISLLAGLMRPSAGSVKVSIDRVAIEEIGKQKISLERAFLELLK